MADRIHLSVISAGGVLLNRMVSYLSIPGADGTVGVLADHMPMLCAVKEGVAKCTFGEGETLRFLVRDGIASVAENEATFLVSDAQVLSEP